MEYATDFMRMTGIPQDLVSPTLSLIGDAMIETDIGRIEDAGLVAHIEEAMRNDLDGFAKSPYAREEYGKALERLNAPRAAAEPGGPIFDDPAYRMAVRSHDTKRRGEIEAAMREDGGRRYWNDRAMQREYGEILSRQTAPPVIPAVEEMPVAAPAATTLAHAPASASQPMGQAPA